jgi:uncharacterized membrane protein HdeD (DUF308 family)
LANQGQGQAIITDLVGSWWTLLLRGIVAVLFGLMAIIWPGLTLAVLVILYGAYALVDGAFALVAGFRAERGTRRSLLLVEGVLGVLAGLVALFWPDITAFVLLYIIAFWAILAGVMRIIAAVTLRQEIDNEWSMGLSGVLSVVLGLILAVLPGVGLVSLAWLIGVFALGVGITLIVLAFRVRGQRSRGTNRVI